MTDASPPRRHRFRIVALIVLLLVVSALVALRLWASDERLTTNVLDVLREQLIGQFELKRLHWDFPDGVVVEGFEVSSPEGAPVLAVERVSVELAMLSLLSARVEAELVEIEGVTLGLRQGPLGIDLARAFTPKVTSAPTSDEPFELPLPIRVDALHVANASLAVSLVELGLGAQIEKLDARVELWPPLQGRLELDLSAPSIRIRSSTLSAPLPALALDLESVTVELDERGAWSAALGGLDLVAPGSRIELEGKARLSPQLELAFEPTQGRAKIDLDAAPWIRALVPGRPLLRGRLALALDLSGQAPSSIQGTAVLHGRQLTFADTSLEALDARVKLDGGRLMVPEVSLSWAGGGRAVLAGRATLFGKERGDHSLSLELVDAPLSEIARPFVEARFLPSAIHGQVSLSGRDLFALESDAKIQIEAKVLPEILPRGLAASASLSIEAALVGDRAQVSALSLSAGSTKLRAHGSVPLIESGAWGLDVQVEDSAPLRFNPQAAKLDGTLEASLEIRGALASPSFGFSTRYAAHGGGSLDAKGRLSTAPKPRLEVDLRLVDFVIDAFTNGIATGTVSATGRIEGPVAALSGRGLVTSSTLEAAKVRFLELSLPWSLTAGRLELHNGMARLAEGGQLGGSAELDGKSGALSAELRAESIPIGILESVLERPVPAKGQAFLEARLGGTIADPTYQADMRVKGGQVSGVPLGRVVGHVEGDLSAVDARLIVDGDVGRVQAKAHYPIAAGDLSAKVTLERVDLGSLTAVASQDVPIGGVLGGEFEIDGKLPTPSIRGTLRASDVVVAEQALGGGVELRVSTTTASMPYVVEAEVFDHLSIRARVAPPPRLAAEARVELSDFGLAPFVPQLAKLGADVRLAGVSDLSFGPQRGLELTAELTRLDLSSPQGDLHASRPIRARYQKEQLSIEHLRLEGSAGHLELEGQFGSAPNVRARGQVELALITPFVEALAEAEGPLQFEALLAGTYEQPALQASASVTQPLRIRARSFPQEVILTGGSVQIERSSVLVDELRGALGDGTFSASGRVELRDLAPVAYDLSVQGVGLPMRTTDLFIEANADLRLTGDGPLPNIKGTVNVVRGRFLRKFRLKDLKLSSEVDTSAPLSETMPELAAMKLDVKVISPSGIDVDVDAGSIRVQLTVVSDLRVRGSPISPRLDGNIGVSMGSIKVPAGKLEIVSAGLDFAPTATKELDAELTLRAEGDIKNRIDDKPYYVRMEIGGRLEELKLDLYSDPHLEPREVLMLLLTGYGGTGTGDDSRASDAALAMAGSQVVGPVADYLSSQLDRVFNLGVELGAEVTGEGLRVTAKKELTRRLQLEGDYTSGKSDVSASASARARLFLLDRLFFETSFKQIYGSGTTGGSDADEFQQKLELKLRVMGN